MKTPLLLALTTLALAPAAQQRDLSAAWPGFLRRFDTDGDGKISPSEYTRGPATFKRLDRDRDGFLTAADFAPAGAAKPPEPATPATPATPEKAASADELQFFEAKIRPLLSSSCFGCHSASAPKLKGGLRLDSREGMLAGGTSGPAIVPGQVEESLLVKAVRYTDDELQMPPKKQLAEESVHDLEKWIAMGAPWPTSAPAAAKAPKAPIDFVKAREFWAFRAPVAQTPPATKDASWAWCDIDRFLLADMEAKGLAPVGDADKRTWLRRVTFDLSGLPPTPEELAAFEADRSPKAFETVVDRLLAAPTFGERWGRHWLDVARYAESSGKDTNIFYPHAWRYRDWVIAAFNADEPYDQFLRAQIAGDLLPAADDDERAANLIATGYLALGAKSQNARDRRQYALDIADEQIDAMSQGMLGLTISCARCHDHKFDPIPTEDYYSLAGIFLSTETRYGTFRGPGNNHPAQLVQLPEGAHVSNGPDMPATVRAVLERAREQFARVAGDGMDPQAPGTKDAKGDGKKGKDDVDRARMRNAREQSALLDELLSRFDEQGHPLAKNRLAMGVSESKPRDVPVLDRGEPDKPGSVAPRGMPRVIASEAGARIRQGSGRKELADWIASASNPLTARVWVNRVWLHLFGAGIVSTPDNFGHSGQLPDHPQLLDALATDFVAKDWSTKDLVREIVLSHAYRLASTDNPANVRIDPEVVSLWRMPERRLEAEAIRDAMLAAAGTLQRQPPVGSPVGVLEGQAQREETLAQITRDRPVRSVYLPILRDHLPDALEVFDAPDASFVTGDREETNVATQALYLMNAEDVQRAADAFAGRLLALKGSDDERISMAFQLALGRIPGGTEREAVRSFLRDFEKRSGKEAPKGQDEPRGRPRGDRRGPNDARADARAPSDPHRAAWSAFAQTLFQCAEFRYLG